VPDGGLCPEWVEDVADTSNPILYVEDLRRFPLRRRRPAMPGTTLVFRSRGGRLSAPPGGYTAGELWWRGPAVAYEVDRTSHPLSLRWDTDWDLPDGRAQIEVSGTWVVSDPCAVVAHRVTDVPRVCRAALQRHLDAPLSSAASLAELAVAVRKTVPPRLLLPQGIRVDNVAPRTVAVATSDQIVRHLLADGEATDGDLAAAWQDDHELAQAGLRAMSEEEDGIAADEREYVIHAALQRLMDLTARIGDHLPAKEEGRYGRDRAT
jgi:hypothetical protein